VKTPQPFGTPWVSLLVRTLPERDTGTVTVDDQLPRSDAAVYSIEWVRETLTDREPDSWTHYRAGVEAIGNGEHAQAIYELETAVREYERLHSDVFEMRNQFEEGQPRQELFEVLWGVYYHLHEAVVAWSNSVIAAQDDSEEAATWRVEAIKEHSTASRHVAEWYRLVVEWTDE